MDYRDLKRVSLEEMEEGSYYIIEATFKGDKSPKYVLLAKCLEKDSPGYWLRDVHFFINIDDLILSKRWYFNPDFIPKIYEVNPEDYPEYFI